MLGILLVKKGELVTPASTLMNMQYNLCAIDWAVSQQHALAAGRAAVAVHAPAALMPLLEVTCHTSQQREHKRC